MKPQRADYQVIPYPKYRRWMVAAYRWAARHQHVIHGLFEVDVTRPRGILRKHQAQTGESLSFTAFLIACLAKAVAEHKAVQAFRQVGKRLVVFDDVDVYVVIEHDLAAQKYIMPTIIRAANRKPVCELHHEIRLAQETNVNDLLKRFWPLYLPTLFYRPFLWAFGWVGSRYPRLWKTTVGMVGISAVGMFGTGAGWGIPAATPTALTLTVGGIGEKQTVVDGHATVREYLSLTISVDHDIVDGAPAARFTQRLKDLIESGYGLGRYVAESEPAAAPAHVPVS
jgi:2-oxoacid dehydrogenases acyltransferase (catalytic domain)